MSDTRLLHLAGPARAGSLQVPALLLAALVAALLAMPSTAAAAGRRTPTLAPSNTVIDGPSAGIVGLDGLAVARDGTGGLVYRKDVGGVPHVFVSVLAGGRFQTPQQVDAGLAGPSSQPVIVADNSGLLLVGVHQRASCTWSRNRRPALPGSRRSRSVAGAANPALSISTFGKAYLAFTRGRRGRRLCATAYYYNGEWALGSAPAEREPERRAPAPATAPRRS